MLNLTSQFVDDLFAAWNSHNLERVAEFYSPEYEGTDISQAQPHYGKAGIQHMLGRYVEAFPDLKFTREQMISDGHQVAIIWQAQGTHMGRVMNIPPTGRAIHVKGTSMLTIENNQITHAVYIWDVAGLLRNIGLLPEL